MQRFSRIATTIAPLLVMTALGVGCGIWATRQVPDDQSSDISQGRDFSRTSTPGDELTSTDLEPSAEPLPSNSADDSLASTQGIANSLVLGDHLLTSGNAAGTLRQYRLGSEGMAEPETVDVTYRLALCAEALGDEAEAFAGYQAVTEMDADGLLQEYALLGQARVLHKQGHTAAAQRVLQRWILSRESAHRLSPQITGDALYLLSAITASSSMEGHASRLWEPNAVCLPRESFNPGRYLPQVSPAAADVSDTRPVGIRIVHQLAESSPDTVTLSGRLARGTIPRVIADLSQQTGWPVEWSQQAEDILRTITVTLDFKEQAANLILDWLLTPQGVAWQFDDGTLKIVTENELTSEQQAEQQWQRTERTLLAALLWDPEHIDTPSAYLLLGNLSFQQGRLQTARRHYEHILQAFPRSSVQAEAWFNLAKVGLSEHDLTKAAQALQGAMDASRGQPLESAALLLAGQTALELDQPRDATRPLMRGVTLATDDNVRALSLLTLAEAHLLDDHPERANVALMEDRRILLTNPHRDRAAFLASLARFRAASTPSRRERDGRELITSMSHMSTAPKLGLSQTLLIAEAYTEVGLTHLAIPLIDNAVTASPPSRLRERLVLFLVDSLIQSGDDERAETLLLDALSDSTAEESTAALLRLSELYSSQQRIEQVETSCRQLLDGEVSPQDRSRALHLLGRVYEARGDRERAVLCYSGVMPQLTEPTN